MDPDRQKLRINRIVKTKCSTVNHHIPSLVLTAVGLHADLERAEALGSSAQLSKPFSQRQLLEAVREVLGK